MTRLEQRAMNIAESSGLRCYKDQYCLRGGACIGCMKAKLLADAIVKLAREFGKTCIEDSIPYASDVLIERILKGAEEQ